MKRNLLLFFILAVIFTFVGCSNNIAKNENISPDTSEVSKNNSNDEKNDNKEEELSVEKVINMNITIGSTTFAATLEDNDTSKALIKQLPLTVEMSEHNGNEKFYNLSSNIRIDKASRQSKINEGDLMLYGDNCLVLFYETFNTSYSYVKLAHIDNTKGLAEALGSGGVEVTFSINQ